MGIKNKTLVFYLFKDGCALRLSTRYLGGPSIHSLVMERRLFGIPGYELYRTQNSHGFFDTILCCCRNHAAVAHLACLYSLLHRYCGRPGTRRCRVSQKFFGGLPVLKLEDLIYRSDLRKHGHVAHSGLRQSELSNWFFEILPPRHTSSIKIWNGWARLW